MRSFRPSEVWIPITATLIVACRFETPGYEDAEYLCRAPPFECPRGHACVDGVCVAAGSPGEGPRGEGEVGEDEEGEPAGGGSENGEGRGEVVVEVVASGDTTLDEGAPDDNDGSDDRIAVDADPLLVGLLRFDLGRIVPGARVVAAHLALHVTNPIESGRYEVHALREAWSEAEATWLRRARDVPWAEAGATGASIDPVPAAIFAPRDLGPADVPLDVSVVQRWIDVPAMNHGLRLRSESPDGRGGNFASREVSVWDHRPKLRVVLAP